MATTAHAHKKQRTSPPDNKFSIPGRKFVRDRGIDIGLFKSRTSVRFFPDDEPFCKQIRMVGVLLELFRACECGRCGTPEASLKGVCFFAFKESFGPDLRGVIKSVNRATATGYIALDMWNRTPCIP